MMLMVMLMVVDQLTPVSGNHNYHGKYLFFKSDRSGTHFPLTLYCRLLYYIIILVCWYHYRPLCCHGL